MLNDLQLQQYRKPILSNNMKWILGQVVLLAINYIQNEIVSHLMSQFEL